MKFHHGNLTQPFVAQMMTNRIIHGDAIEELTKLPEQSAQLIIADPPYFQVLIGEAWG